MPTFNTKLLIFIKLRINTILKFIILKEFKIKTEKEIEDELNNFMNSVKNNLKIFANKNKSYFLFTL